MRLKCSLSRSSLLVVCLAGLNVVNIEVRAQTCVAAPNGLVSWWQGQGNAIDRQSGNNGTLQGNTRFVPGLVGDAFGFDGDRDAVVIGNPGSLQLQDFTIEAWIARTSPTKASAGNGGGAVFSFGDGGFGFGVFDDGHLFLTQLGGSFVASLGSVTDTNWHQVAVTKSGSSVIFYFDGVADSSADYPVVFVFSTPAGIGARGDLQSGFLGAVDELSIYNRALDVSEVQSVYGAGSAGKCTPAPVVINPRGGFFTNSPAISLSTTDPGVDIFFTLDGSDPSANSVAYADPFTVTDTTIVKAQSFLNGAPFSDSACEVYRIWGSSSGCVSPPGLISWWSGDCNTSDPLGGNIGVLQGNTSYQPGKAGAAFEFDGVSSAVVVSNVPNLRLQTLTIEAWIKRSSPTAATLTGFLNGTIFAYGNGGYGFAVFNDGRILLTRVGASYVASSMSVTDTEWHHVAVTREGTNVAFYIDGAAEVFTNYNPNFTFSSDAAIGATGGSLGASFYGLIDELGVYNRALTASEIQSLVSTGTAGKCPNYPPALIVPPGDQNVALGSNVTFAVSASGWRPLSYGWSFNGNSIAGATNRTISITNVQYNAAGGYTVTVSNSFGSITSGAAALIVSDPPAITNQPVSQTVLIGSAAVFTVGTGGTAPFAFQWRLNGSVVSGATSPTLIINNAQLKNAGVYTVRVTNAVASTISLPATLTIASGQLSIQAVSNGIQLTVAGEPGADYVIESSSLLTNWTSLATELNAPTNWQYLDTSTAGTDQRSYRLHRLP